MSNGTFMLFSSPDYVGLPSSSHLPFYPSDICFQMPCRQLWQSRMQSPGERKWAAGWLEGRASRFSKLHKSWASRTSYNPDAGATSSAVFTDSLPVLLILNQSFPRGSLRHCTLSSSSPWQYKKQKNKWDKTKQNTNQTERNLNDKVFIKINGAHLRCQMKTNIIFLCKGLSNELY